MKTLILPLMLLIASVGFAQEEISSLDGPQPAREVMGLNSAAFINGHGPSTRLEVAYSTGGCDSSKHVTTFALKNLKIDRELRPTGPNAPYHEIYASAEIHVLEKKFGACAVAYEIHATADLKQMLKDQARRMGIDTDAPYTLFEVTYKLGTPLQGLALTETN